MALGHMCRHRPTVEALVAADTVHIDRSTSGSALTRSIYADTVSIDISIYVFLYLCSVALGHMCRHWPTVEALVAADTVHI